MPATQSHAGPPARPPADGPRPHAFALIGVAGFIAPRHLKAIKDTGNDLVAAVDPHDSVGVLDRYFTAARFFTEIERFDRHLEKLRRLAKHDPAARAVEYVSICSPNYLHDAHVRLALRVGAHAICEKPLVINPWNLDQLAELEQEYGRRVFTVLQLRLHPAVAALKAQLDRRRARGVTDRAEVNLAYVTRRGAWYHASWKGTEDKSGGLSMNIGIHFFDLLLWLFGPAAESHVSLNQPDRMAGVLELEHARVRWFLSVNEDDLPPGTKAAGAHAFRTLTIDGQAFDFSGGFDDLHTRVYEETLAGRGFGIDDARPSIELVYRIRRGPIAADVEDVAGYFHKVLQNA
jgi:UDP-N-acetyl-2-amino-2-deoxyglucuronate dehydrogenase